MKRNAIIIGSSLTTKNPKYLKGVQRDVNNYTEFLTSSIGGGWLKSEIISLCNPTRFQLLNAINQCNGSDVTLIVFTGHGVRHDEDFIQINDYDTLPLSVLNVAAKKQIIISDACRSQAMMEHFEGLAGTSLNFDQRNKDVARALYDQAISSLEDGVITLYSSSPGENSQDTIQGGLFSTTLLEVVHSWSSSQSEVTFTIDKAFQKTSKKLSPRQHPKGTTTSDGMRNFPFAINPVNYLASIEINKRQFGFGEVAAILAVSFFAGCFIAAVVD